MPASGLKTPVLFIIFNRPETTARVFEAICRARPEKLFVAADGPRLDRPADIANCEKARKIVENIDWPCQVKKLFQTDNLGCGRAVSGAITWFFSQTESGIILEDDCLPDDSFFPFCQELLSHYADDPRIMHISGDNFQHGKRRGPASYYLSKYPHIWGWATWARAWKKYRFDSVGEKERLANWDKQWQMAVRENHGLAALPNVNLVSNIGFAGEATHTTEDSRLANLPTRAMDFPIVHPTRVARNRAADYLTYKEIFGGTLGKLMRQKISSLIPAKLKHRIKNITKYHA